MGSQKTPTKWYLAFCLGSRLRWKGSGVGEGEKPASGDIIDQGQLLWNLRPHSTSPHTTPPPPWGWRTERGWARTCSSQLTCSQGPKEVPGSLKENPTSAFIKGPEERCPGSPRAPRLGGKGSWGRGQKGSPARPLGACRCHPPAAVETWLPARGSARPPRPSLPSASENLRVFPLLLTAHLLSLCLSLGLSLCLTHTHTILLYSEDL